MIETAERVEDRLADFTRDKRILLLSLMAVIVGEISALVAKALVWLIAIFTNLTFYRRLISRASLLAAISFARSRSFRTDVPWWKLVRRICLSPFRMRSFMKQSREWCATTSGACRLSDVRIRGRSLVIWAGPVS